MWLKQDVFTKSVWPDPRSLRSLDAAGSTLQDMDVIAVALGLVSFAILVGALRLIERI